MATGKIISDIDFDAESQKNEWLDHLFELVRNVQKWAVTAGWRTRQVEKTLTERRLGSYKVPVLLMEKNTIEIVLNPVARFVPGADGAVDLYVAPAYDDIASLYLVNGKWVLHYSTSFDKRLSLIESCDCTEQVIRSVLDAMTTNG
jgi:hypothetical protein